MRRASGVIVWTALAVLAACGGPRPSPHPDGGDDVRTDIIAVDRAVEDSPEPNHDVEGAPGEAPTNGDQGPAEAMALDATALDEGTRGALDATALDEGTGGNDSPSDGAVCTPQTFPDAWLSRRISFSPDGQIIGGDAGDGGIRVYAGPVRQYRLSDWTLMPGPNVPPCPAPIDSLGYFPDGQTIALGYCGGMLGIFKNGSFAFRLVDLVLRYAIAPDGELVATSVRTVPPDGSNAAFNVSLWNAADGTLKTSLTTHVGTSTDLAFSPDGTMLAVSTGEATVDLWQVASGSLLKTIATDHAVVDLEFPSSRVMATLSDNQVLTLWDLVSYTSTSIAVDSLATEIAASRGGELLFVSGSTLAAYWTRDLSLAYLLDTEPVYSIAVSPDGVRVAATKTHGALQIYCLP
jgi:WD40 repeat protein